MQKELCRAIFRFFVNFFVKPKCWSGGTICPQVSVWYKKIRENFPYVF